MADSSIAITAGAGTDVDTRTAPDGNHRQVVTLGDPATAETLDVATTGGTTAGTETGLLPMGIVSADDVARTDGQTVPLLINADGRLKVASKPGSYADTTKGITAAGAALANVLAVDVSDASNVMFHVKNTGSVLLAAGTFIFEGSIDSTDGVNGTWFGVQAVRSNANTIETQIALSGIAAAAGFAAAWEASVNALKWFRLRCSVNVTASAIAYWTAIRGTYATEPIPAAQASATQAVSGTLTSAGTTTATPATPTATILNSAATTNGTVVKGSAGTLYSVTASNVNAAVRYVKLHNATTVTPGTTAVAMTIPIASWATVNVPFGALGMRFGTGICLSITALAADTDTTVVGVGDVKVLAAFI